jgi:hypothetical protein
VLARLLLSCTFCFFIWFDNLIDVYVVFICRAQM